MVNRKGYGITVVGELHAVPRIMEEEIELLYDLEPDYLLHEGWDDRSVDEMDALMTVPEVWRSKQDIEDYFAEQYDRAIFQNVEPAEWGEAVQEASRFGSFLRPETAATALPTVVDRGRVHALPETVRTSLQEAAGEVLDTAYNEGLEQDAPLARDIQALQRYLELEEGAGNGTQDHINDLRQYYLENDIKYAGCDIDKTELAETVYAHTSPRKRYQELHAWADAHEQGRERTMALSMVDAAEDGDVLAIIGSSHAQEGSMMRAWLELRCADYTVIDLGDLGLRESLATVPHAIGFNAAWLFGDVLGLVERREKQDAFVDAVTDAPVADYRDT